MMIIILLVLGSIGGFLSGLLGIGGAIIMIPLMLYIPPALGAGLLTMKTVAGLSMIQVFFSSLSGIYRHRKNNFIHTKLLLVMGSGMLIGSMTGGLVSDWMDNDVITIVFGILALCAAILMMFPPPHRDETTLDLIALRFNPYAAFFLSLITGFLSGIAGAGGGFILIPIMIYLLRVPTKIAIGTSIGVVFLGAMFGAAGKAFTGQIDWLYVLPLVFTSIPFAQLGGITSRKVSAKWLRYMLLVIILITCFQVWKGILGA
ncbi:MAG TPA: sulfite exporter TauE/SafE family protein [Anaerolineaceae bacterium]